MTAAPAKPAPADAAVHVARAAVGELKPACAEVLPSVQHTLRGIVHATESAAQTTLDATDALAGRHRDLVGALGRLRPFVPSAGAAAWREVAAATNALPGGVNTVVGAMGFQDLTAQHLAAAIDALDGLRQRLAEVLALAGVTVDADAAAVRIAPKLGAPAAASPWRQELADDLVADERGVAP